MTIELNPRNIVIINESENSVIVQYPNRVIVSDIGLQGATGEGVPTGGTTGQILAKNSNSNHDTEWIDPPTSGVWGQITGTLSDQTDLQTALNNKQPLSSVLTNTTASFTTAQESKLSGIASGAEVNVNADWNSVSGDAQILNKPDLNVYALKSQVYDLTTITYFGGL